MLIITAEEVLLRKINSARIGGRSCTSLDAANADSNRETCRRQAIKYKKSCGKVWVPECNEASFFVVYLLLVFLGHEHAEEAKRTTLMGDQSLLWSCS